MNQDIPQSEILSDVRDGVGIITLNRPEALNALTLEMIRQISFLLTSWDNDDSIHAVLFTGAGERAFCSGGDVKSFYRAGMGFRRGEISLSVPALFFKEEYSLNRQIFHYSKPTIALMDGIVMGGGYGIGGHCRHRIATKNTVFAMPEVGIGFFPDIGAVYHLNRTPLQFGRYLALTGASVGGEDMVAGKMADYYIESCEVEQALDLYSKDGFQELQAVSGDVLKAHHETLEACFASSTPKDIIAALERDGGDFAQETLDLLRTRSPISIAVTAKHMETLHDADFDTVIVADFHLAQSFIHYPDLYEGIRAQLIDKDKSPLWEPPGFDAITPLDVDRYFQTHGPGLPGVV